MTVQHNWLTDSIALSSAITITVSLNVADTVDLDDDPSGEGYDAPKNLSDEISISSEVGVTVDA